VEIALRVLVSYRRDRQGRAALVHAVDVANRAGVPLTVVSVIEEAPVVGCASCRHSAVLWNQELRDLAGEELAEAAGVAAGAEAAEYVVGVGDPVGALADAAASSGADIVVVPWERAGRPRPWSRGVARKLRKRGSWEVVVAPPAA
jgi:nucleotide-binding universal stress UspA family protein